jgi:hypothetical protein
MDVLPSSRTAMPRWKQWAFATLAVLLGVALGLGSAWWAVRGRGLAGPVQIGAWSTSTLSGHVDADLYTRARVAVGGLLALSREETMYYVARTDDSGAPLRAECRYRIEGVAPPARWWSITAYAGDLFLFQNAPGRYSINGSTAQLDAKGRFGLATGPSQPERPEFWLPTPKSGPLVLTLRLYNPDARVAAMPASLPAPSISRIGACA